MGDTAPDAPIPTNPTDYDTVAAARPGGSSVRVEAPCDGGTVSVRAYPDGSGVAMTTTLRDPAHATWRLTPWVSPQRDPEGEETPESPHRTGTVQDGILVTRTDNFSEPYAVKGVKGIGHAWPQAAGLGLTAGEHVDCSTSVYLDAHSANAETTGLIVDVKRSGAVSVTNSPLGVAGVRHIDITVSSPDGDQHQAKDVPAKLYPGESKRYAHPYIVETTFKGLTHLSDFTSMTVTVTRRGQRTTWMTLSRTP